MSTNIMNTYVQQYSSVLTFLLQQKGSKLRPYVRSETITGEKSFFDYIGPVNAVMKTGRHQPTPVADTPFTRRMVVTQTWLRPDFLDPKDDIRMLISPDSAIAENQAMALGRAMDDAILAAVEAVAKTGQDGSTNTSYDSNMTVGVQTVWDGVTPADTGLNVAKLVAIRRKLGAKHVEPDEEIYLAANTNQITSLLKDERYINKDYSGALTPLLNGVAVKFMGINIIPCERIPSDGTTDERLPYWTRNGLLLAMGQDIQVTIDRMPTRTNSTQILSTADFGATRMEESRVGVVVCDPGASPTVDA